MPIKATVTFEELLEIIEKLPYKQFQKAIEHYSVHNKANFEKDLEALVSHNLQTRLLKLGINAVCPNCGSIKIIKYGNRHYTQRFKCNDCGITFTLLTNTILEKTKWHWDIWVKVLNMLINDTSILDMKETLEQDYSCYIDDMTLFLWVHKLIHALAIQPMPKLTGVIQIDETFVRESQKGSLCLYSTISKKDVREPRHERQASKFGVMGPEFATVVTAIDNQGYCVCKISGLGRLKKEVFTDLFEEHLINPAFICTDANPIYDEYCRLFHISHYIRPSTYDSIIDKAGITMKCETIDDFNKLPKNQRALYENLYREQEIDRVTNAPLVSYPEFLKIRAQYGLSLRRVNSLHAKIKEKLYIERRNVSTKYLEDYVGFIAYIHNWKIKNGHQPASEKDAESIFIDILKSRAKYTISDLKEAKLNLPKPSSRYITVLKAETEKARKATKNPQFEFTEEDNVGSFNKREYLISLGKNALRKICRERKIPGYTLYSTSGLAMEILRMSDVDNIIYNLMNKGKDKGTVAINS